MNIVIPLCHKTYPLDAHKIEELKKTFTNWLDSNQTIPSDSLYGDPILFAFEEEWIT